MKKFFLLISVFMCFISYSEEQIFLKVIKKEIKSQKSKINYSKEVNINIEEYDFYMNGEIIREYDSTKENNKKIYYVVGRYDVIVLNTLLDKILENDISEINSLKVSFSNKKNLDTDVFSVLKVTEEDFMINISINDENRYNRFLARILICK